MIETSLGKATFVPRGQHDSSLSYDRLNIVTNDDNTAVYVAIKSVPSGTALSNTEFWMKFLTGLTIGEVDDVAWDAGASAEIVIDPETGLPVLNLSIPRGITGSESIVDTAGIGDDDVVYSADHIVKYCFTRQTMLTAVDDCDDLDYMGSYYATAAVAEDLANWPDPTVGGRLLQFRVTTSESGRIQFVGCNDGQLYYRASTGDAQGSTFSQWRRIEPEHKIMKINMTEASIGPSGGKWASGLANFANDKSVAAIHRYRSRGTKYIKITWTPAHSGDHFSFFQYTAAGESSRKGYNAVSVGVPQTHKVKVNAETETFGFGCIDNGNEGTPNKQFIIETDGAEIEEMKLPSFGSNISDTRWFRFGYKAFDYLEDGEKKIAYTTGIMIMPPNYDPEGKPVPVIMFCHGSSSYQKLTGTIDHNHDPFIEFLADCGYAVIDCYGWTNRFPDVNAESMSSLWAIPTCCKSYISLVNLLTDAYNLDRNNMFVLCKSLGGHMAAWLSTALPLKAACFLAPAIRLNLGYKAAEYREAMIEDLGLVGVVDDDLGWTTEEDCLDDFKQNYYLGWNNAKRRKFYLANGAALIGWSPEFINVVGKTASEKLINAAEYGQDVSLQKIGVCPSKFWVEVDDPNVSVQFIQTYAQQIRNGGTYADVVLFPSGSGGHHATDYDPNAPKVEDITTPLGYHYETVPLAYYEAWEFMERNRE